MLWGVMNLSLQAMSFLQQADAETAGATIATDSAGWTWSWTMALLFSLIPFLSGLSLYLGVFKKAARARALQSPSAPMPGSQ